MKIMKIIEKEDGLYEDKGGFLVRLNDDGTPRKRSELLPPTNCPCCSGGMDKWDDKHWFKYGICAHCFINYVADRAGINAQTAEKAKILDFARENLAASLKK